MSTPQFAELLTAWHAGNKEAFNQLAALVDTELRRLAHHYLRRESVGHTLQTTALVNEAWVRLLDSERIHWENRAHFIAAAATTMRHVLVDWARTYQYQKRGGGAVQVSLGEAMLVEPERSTELVAIHEALERLAEFNANAACVVEWRFFGGLQNKEIAEAMGISETAATRYWHFAQSWLKRELTR